MATLYLKVPNSNIFWNTLSNWYQDSNCTIPATSLPTASDDVIVLTLINTYIDITLQSIVTINNLTVEGFRNSKNNNHSSYSIQLTRQGPSPILNVNNIILNNSSVSFLNLLTNVTEINLNGYSYLSNNAQNSAISANNININNFSILNLNTSAVQNIIFNDNSSYSRLDLANNGNITFNDNSNKLTNLGINSGTASSFIGNIILTNNIYNFDDYFPIIGGDIGVDANITFNSLSPVNFTLSSNNSWNLDSSVWTFSSSLSPSWTFNDTSFLNNGNLVGNATFNDSSYQTGNSIVSNSSIVTFNEDSYQAGKITNGSITYDGFNGTNSSGFFVNGQKVTYLGIPVTISSSATFNNSSVHGDTLTGNAVFNNSSFNIGTINGDATFNNSSSNYNPNMMSMIGYVTGSITCNTTATYCPGYPPRTLYFNGAADGDWNNLSNWWANSASTIPAFLLPTSIDSVIASAPISSNSSGSTPTINNLTGDTNTSGLGISLTVSGSGIFNNSFGLESGFTLTGNAFFNNTSSNQGTILGNVTFNNSYNNGTIGDQYQSYTVVCNSGSINGNGAAGYIYGNVTFNSGSHNGGNYGGYIYGDAIFNTDCSNGGYNEGGVISGNTIVFNKNSTNSSVNTNYATTSITATTTIFNDTSANLASITGNGVFNHNSYMEDSGNISGNATFNNESSNRTNISGSVTLNPDRGINGSSILGLV